MPKPSYHGFRDQLDFYEEFFANARRVGVSKRLVDIALREACQYGLSACDALHIAAARLGKCVDFVTTEKPSRPLFRVTGLSVISLQASNAST
jgi:predicted nucleic acid-binding protein